MTRSQRRVVTWLALSLLASACIGTAQAREPQANAGCVAITPKQVAALFDRWNAALATKDPDAAVRTYAPDAVLLPTVENGPLIGRQAIRGYFVAFLKKHPNGIIDTRTIRIGCNMAYDAGLYTFTVDGDQPGSRTQIHARYTFIYAPEGGHWLIVHHHSSKQPGDGH